MKKTVRVITNVKEKDTTRETICRMKSLKVKSNIKVGDTLTQPYYGMGGMWGRYYPW